MIYVVYLKRPSRQLHLLEDAIRAAEDTLTTVKVRCPRDVNGIEQGVRLVEIKRSASVIRCRMLQMAAWKTYWHLSREIYRCTTDITNLRIGVEACLSVEAELQRAYNEEIEEREALLAVVTRASAPQDWLSPTREIPAAFRSSSTTTTFWRTLEQLYRFDAAARVTDSSPEKYSDALYSSSSV
ncbi:hypothetical protein C8R46DRAFT_1223650 [Mycena filopes]|nr:hypothetical protein C8R46DRAFT_1223650 [Mycena filopes]